MGKLKHKQQRKARSSHIISKMEVTKSKFIDATKSMLLKLASQRKSLTGEQTLRQVWKNQHMPIEIKDEKAQQPSKSEHQMRSEQQKPSTLYNYQYLSEQGMNQNNSQAGDMGSYINYQDLSSLNVPKIQQFKPKKKIKLFNFTLRELVLKLLEQIKNSLSCICAGMDKDTKACICRRYTAVHRTIEQSAQIQAQIQRLSNLAFQQQFPFPEDQIISMSINKVLQSWIFAKHMVSPYEHRALAMLLKRINTYKYSLAIPTKTVQYRNNMLNTYYAQLYAKPVEDYYLKLLALQCEFKRYASHSIENIKIQIGLSGQQYPPTNFIRKLLLLLFKQNIKGDSRRKTHIQKLQQHIESQLIAEQLLKVMRKQIIKQDPLKQEIKRQNFSAFTEERQINRAGKAITQEQREAIQRTLEHHRKGRKFVPYPYCLFLQYRLRAQPSPNIPNNNPSSDEQEQPKEGVLERRRLKQENIYRGYRGYKSLHRLQQKRKIKKGIAESVKQMGKIEHFELGNMMKKQETQQITQVTSSGTKKAIVKKRALSTIQEQSGFGQSEVQKSQHQTIPFPFNLSIFGVKPQNSQDSIYKSHNQGQKGTIQIDD